MATVTSVTGTHDDDVEATMARRTMTLQEFNALPEDPTVDRMLINGELWEKPMTKRNRWHAGIEARIAQHLANWLDEQSPPFGKVFSGEVGCDFPDSESGFGIDVAVFTFEVLATQAEGAKFIVGVPVLAVEILSPSERQEEIQAKTDTYLDSGVKCVWIVDPHFKTITAFRSDEKPTLFSGDDEISGEPYLPGFGVRTDKLFE
jgi:Uma2 family endonuclease